MARSSVGLAGYGARLTTVAHLLDRTDTAAAWWEPGEATEGERRLEQLDVPRVDLGALAEASLIVVSVPIRDMRATARKLGDVLSGRHVLLHLGRTFEQAALEPISSIFEEETPTRRFGHLTGPMQLDDVLAERSASAVCASAFPEVVELAEEALSSPRFRIYRHDDLIGAEAASAYTRIIAAADGIAEAMGLGASCRSTLFARGLAEAGRFVEHVGGDERTAFGLAGAGNLRGDTSGGGSPDWRIGRSWAQNGGDLEDVRATLAPIEDEFFEFLDALQSRLNGQDLDLHVLRALSEGMLEQRGVERTLDGLQTLPEWHT